MKKLLVIGAAVAGALVLRRKWQESKVQKTNWNQATDKVE
ncbi:DLW-39 family protein [Paenarthrobacter sp. PH39-S1]|nr:DLW-39 family protein [Paenarthrobacter sp. PH39-S1]MDJ0355766.1 DLW-39 family protein [Paenarthrobacter sp. PH39-S1]